MEIGVIPSTRTVGDPDDKTIAEAINTLDKSKLIRARGPWRTAAQVERATLDGCGGRTIISFTFEADYSTPVDA